jgi:membrane-associated protease RseP (regulator of RpoE activity)
MPVVPGAGDQPAANEPRPGFLGVMVDDVPESLAAHLEIPNGQGALVRQITPGSPAEKAGLQVHDILLKAAGKPVNGGPSVSEIVASKNAGEELEVELLRKGEKQQLRIVLDARPAGLMGQAGPGFDDAFLENLPQDQAARIRDMIERNLRAMRDPGGLAEDDVFQDAFRGMREQMEQMLNDAQAFEVPAAPEEAGGFGRMRMNVGATVRLMDNEGSVEIKSVDGGKEVVVRDKANETIWAGPWDTPQDKAAAPDDIRARIERLNIEGFEGGNGLKLRMFNR